MTKTRRNANETDIERIERALSGVDQHDLDAITNCVSGGRFDVQAYGTGSGQ